MPKFKWHNMPIFNFLKSSERQVKGRIKDWVKNRVNDRVKNRIKDRV